MALSHSRSVVGNGLRSSCPPRSRSPSGMRSRSCAKLRVGQADSAPPAAMALSDEELDRYARHIVLPQIGGAGQLKLKVASIAVVGAGGIGAGAIPALTGVGIGHLTIIDDDRVELSNLQRQPLYAANQVGERKADLAARFIGKRNPHVECRTLPDRVDKHNLEP